MLPEIKDYELRTDHVLDGLRKLPGKCVHSITFSPPFMGLRDYETVHQIWGGKNDCKHAWNIISEKKRNGELRWPESATCLCGAWKGELGLEPYVDLYIEHMVLIMREAKRVLRDDGTIFLNIGDSSNAGIRRPLRPGVELDPLDALLIPWRLGIALQEDGFILRQDIIHSKSGGNCPECGFRMEKGDAKPAPVTGKLVPAHEYVLLLTKTRKYYFDYVGIQTKENVNRRDVLFLPTTRYSGAHYAVMSDHLAEFCVTAGVPPKCCKDCGAPYTRQIEGQSETKADRLARIEGKTKDYIAPRHDGGKLQQGLHIGTFKRITLGWEKSCNCETQETIPGIALDFFSGSGTTGAACLKLFRRYLGIDLDPKNKELAEERLQKELEKRGKDESSSK